MTRVLAISAHPDDAELGAGGYIQRFDERRIVVLSSGEKGGGERERIYEQTEACKILGASSLVHALDDTSIELTAAIHIIEDHISEWKPDLVLTIAARDTHQDHRTTHEATMVAVRDYPCTVLAYVGPSSAATFQPNWFVELTEREMAVKQAAVACHRSQSGRSYMLPAAIEGMARYWSMVTRSKLQWVEAFETIKAWG